MANEVSFGAQLKESWGQIRRNRALLSFMVILMLISIALMIPVVVMTVIQIRAAGGPPQQPSISMILCSSLITILLFPVFIGYMREFFHPAPASFSRPFLTGFARFRQVLYLLPLYILSSVVWFVYAALPPQLTMLLWLPYMAFLFAYGIYWQCLVIAAAIGEDSQPCGELYANGWAAFRYGWWRLLVVNLILAAGYLVFLIPVILLAVMVTLGIPAIVPIIIGLIWVCVGIVATIYLTTFQLACAARFYRDAFGMPDPDEPPRQIWA
ncbi:MAG: hypothetical protein HPZ91_00860 [Lentisphaeria bacterium]|nr:hypothetical protein [Lentisphaeria bacterium]